MAFNTRRRFKRGKVHRHRKRKMNAWDKISGYRARHYGIGMKDRPTVMQYNGPDKTIVPAVYRCRLNYCQIFDFSGVAMQEQVMRGNALFDPNQTGTGAQCPGYDQLVALYASNRVLASRITIQYVPDDSNTEGQNVWYAVFPCIITSPSIINFQDVISQPYCKWYVTNLYSPKPKVINYRSTANMSGQGIPEGVSIDNGFAGTGSTLPIYQWYWIVVAGSVNGTTAMNGHIVVNVTYYAEFFNRNTLVDL